jgi:hypothetical protein
VWSVYYRPCNLVCESCIVLILVRKIPEVCCYGASGTDVDVRHL